MLQSTKINSTRSVEGTRGTLRDRPDHVICGSGILTLKVPRRYTWKLMTFFGVKNGQVAPNKYNKSSVILCDNKIAQGTNLWQVGF